MMSFFVQKVFKTYMKKNDEGVFNRESEAVNPEVINNQEVSDNPENSGGLQLHRVGAIDIVQEGYGKLKRSEEKCDTRS